MAGLITQFNVNFLGGEFNMSLTQGVVELSKRGIKADTCAWTPWLHESAAEHGSRLGIDSMALLYIGGGVLCKMPWNTDNIGKLVKAAACAPGKGPQLRHETRRVEDRPKGSGKGKGKNKPAPPELNMFGDMGVPGQPWFCYKSYKGEKAEDARLEPKLRNLLTPSTSVSSCSANTPSGKRTTQVT